MVIDKPDGRTRVSLTEDEALEMIERLTQTIRIHRKVKVEDMFTLPCITVDDNKYYPSTITFVISGTKMNITKISVLLRDGSCDVIFIHTDLPAATYPYEEKAVFKMDAAIDTGVDYCKQHFPDIEVEVISTR